jgi:hypothetical protein
MARTIEQTAIKNFFMLSPSFECPGPWPGGVVMLYALLDRIEAESLVRCLAPPAESVVHADQDSGRGRFGSEGTTSDTGTNERGD